MSSRWSIYDFILVWLGGQLGSVAFFLVGTGVGADEWIHVLGLAGGAVGTLGVFWLLTRFKSAGDVRLTVAGRDPWYIGVGLILVLAFNAVFFPLNDLLFPEGRPPQEVAEIIAGADTMSQRIALVVLAVVFAPLTEEITYRGVLLKALEPRGKWFAVVVSSVVFAAVHAVGLGGGEFWRLAVVVLVPIFLLGMVLAWLTLRIGRLGPAIFIHSGWNLLGTFVLLLPEDLLEQLG